VVFESKPDLQLDYPGTWQQFRAWFPDEQACIAYLEHLRWPDGFSCPKCGGGKGWRLPDGRWGCAGCARKVSVTAGTIFDRSRVPLADWFTAIWFMTNQKYGVSALGLQRLLGLGSYQTAWTMLRKLRSAMVRPGRDRLQGTVEVDETYVGGIEQGKRGRSAERKFMVTIAIEVLDPQGFGRVRLKMVEDGSSHSLTVFVRATA
jgi:transposase-like protein